MEKRKRSGRKSKFVFLLLAAALIAATAFYFKDNITSMIGSITKFLGGAADEISYSAAQSESSNLWTKSLNRIAAM